MVFNIIILFLLHLDITKQLLCYQKEFQAIDFRKCVEQEPPDPNDFEKHQAFEWFSSYIEENTMDDAFPGGCRLKALLQFCTGYQVPPPVETTACKITLSYLPDDDACQFSLAQACMGYLKLPVVHSSLKKFTEMMDIALKCESEGFGCV